MIFLRVPWHGMRGRAYSKAFFKSAKGGSWSLNYTTAMPAKNGSEKAVFNIKGFFPRWPKIFSHSQKRKCIFFYCPDKLGQTHDSVCSRTQTGLKVLDYFLFCYKQPFLPPALGQSKKSGTFSRVTKKGMVCLSWSWRKSTSRKETFYAMFQWWRWKH